MAMFIAQYSLGNQYITHPPARSLAAIVRRRASIGNLRGQRVPPVVYLAQVSTMY